MGMMSAWWVRRSTIDTTQAAFGNTSPHSLKARLEVRMVLFFS